MMNWITRCRWLLWPLCLFWAVRECVGLQRLHGRMRRALPSQS